MHAIANGHTQIVQEILRATDLVSDLKNTLDSALEADDTLVFETIFRELDSLSDSHHPHLCLLQEDDRKHTYLLKAMTKNKSTIAELMLKHERVWYVLLFLS